MTHIFTAPEALGVSDATFAAMLVRRLRETPDNPAFRFPNADGEWETLTWSQTGEATKEIAAGLIHLGVESEQRVAIAAETSINWVLAELGITLAGAATTTVYASTGPSDAAFILADSNSQVMFAADQTQVDKILGQRDAIPELGKIVVFEGEGDDDLVITLEQLKDLGREELASNPTVVDERAAAVEPQHLATLIYTSGTTGRPKGVELLHSTWGYVGAALRAEDILTPEDVQFLWLPMAHVFGTVLITVAVEIGMVTGVDGRVPKILENVAIVKPTFMGAVPRIFEKLHAVMAAMAKAGGPEKEQGFAWAVDVGKRYHQALLDNVEPDPELTAQFAKADELVLSQVRNALGGKVRFFISGAAPLSTEVALFFFAAGMPILEGYGLTETAAVLTISRPTTLKPGSVGEPQPGTEVKLADDGEILVRSPAVMRGYRNRPDATAEVLVDGWFATGDIGTFDEYGRLTITDRKKDLYKTSGGKYVAPSAIESEFKGICGLASNMVVHADNRKYVSAIITLDPDSVAMWAGARGKPTDLATASKDPELVATVDAAVAELNSRLNPWESVKKFVILDRDFTIESGELTPSLKVKRRVIADRHKELLDSLYN
ncbi:MAG: AMP-dependent synthetase/ligase [Candidatus Nanopelagicales bacterium]